MKNNDPAPFSVNWSIKTEPSEHNIRLHSRPGKGLNPMSKKTCHLENDFYRSSVSINEKCWIDSMKFAAIVISSKLQELKTIEQQHIFLD